MGFAAKLIRAASIGAVAGIGAALGLSAPVSACVGQYLSGDPALDELADMIFTGTAVRMDGDPQGGVLEWTFVVDGVEKGQVGDRLTVSAFTEESMCGMRFDLGTRYRVLARDEPEDAIPQVSSVGGTTPTESLANPPAVEGEFPRRWDWMLTLAGIGVAALIGLAAFKGLVSRHRRALSTP
jgi:hypothetical protein